jgi:hypothetical protein
MNFEKTGWIINGNKERTMVVFKCNNGKWYMSSGVIVAFRNGFTSPTQVYLYYQLKKNNLLMYHACLPQFAPPYEVPCDSPEHPKSYTIDGEENDHHVSAEQVDNESTQRADQSSGGHFDINIVGTMCDTTNHLVRYSYCDY